MYMWLVRKLWDPPSDEKSRVALMMIDESITQIKTSEDETSLQLREILTKLKSAQTVKRTAAMKELLKNGKMKRQRLAAFQRKRTALESHREAISANEINQQVLSTVKHTSAALKSLGIEESIQSVDAIMMEMEEVQQDVSTLSNDLSASIDNNEITDEDFMKELNNLMEDEDEYTPEIVTKKSNDQNSMNSVTLQIPEQSNQMESQVTTIVEESGSKIETENCNS